MTYEEQLKQVRDNVIKNVYPTIQQQGSSNTMITLHWTAGHYDQLFDDYHMCIDGSGNVHVMQDLDLPLSQVFTHGERCLARQDLYDYPAERWDLDILVPECHTRTEDGLHTAGGNWIRNRAREIAKMNGINYL